MTSVFQPCGCGHEHFERIHRRFWMRLLPGVRFYRCKECGRHQLGPRRLW